MLPCSSWLRPRSSSKSQRGPRPMINAPSTLSFAEIEVRMQRELQRGGRALEAYGHIRTRLCGCHSPNCSVSPSGQMIVSRPCLIGRLSYPIGIG